MNWSVAFESLLPGWLLIVAGVVAALLVVPGILRRMRGSILRAVAALFLFVALLNPVALREDREALPTVVALVVDKSASQTLDGRDKTTAAARDALQKQLAQFRGLDVRTIEAGSGISTDGTNLFGPLANGLADVPPDRVGAAIMLTDGEVHDVPAKRDALPAAAPLHVLLSGHEGDRARRIVIDRAPRFGLVW